MIYGLEDVYEEYLDAKIKISLVEGVDILSKQGINRNDLEGKIEVAKIFIKNGLTSETINQILGLEYNLIEELKLLVRN